MKTMGTTSVRENRKLLRGLQGGEELLPTIPICTLSSIYVSFTEIW